MFTSTWIELGELWSPDGLARLDMMGGEKPTVGESVGAGATEGLPE
ncbi:hypothetical protein [Citricoccus sp. GCM10030269]